LREKGSAYKRFDQPGVHAKEGGGAALHHFETGTVGVMEGENNAGGIFAQGKIGRISKPSRRKKNFTAVADGITGKFSFKILRGGGGAVRSTSDGNATDDNMSETGDGDTAGAGTEGGAEDGIEDRDVLR